MKLALGTAQFGLNYGVNNQKGIPHDFEISKIFKHAKINGIDLLDSASAYGDAEKKIGNLSNFEFKIVSKFSKVINARELFNQLNSTLSVLKQESLFAYLAHNPDLLIKYPILWEELLIRKNNGTILKIGYSLYTTEQLERLLKLGMVPDLVQLPYSLLDRKFENYFEHLKSLGTEIHTRSAFLQGLYFYDLKALPSKFEPLRNELTQLITICRENQIKIGSLALNFALNNTQIDKVVIGVDSLEQLKKNLIFSTEFEIQNDLIKQIKNIETKFPEMLNPVNW
jgi:aryl-alcohol dehydrogenase-like predicted oxidoreductase